MAMPPRQDIYLPFLKILADGQPHKMHEISSQLEQFFQLTPEEREEKVKSGQKRFHNRVMWARMDFKMAQLIESHESGSVKITERGKEVLRQNPDRIDCAFLRRYPEYVAATRTPKASDDNGSSTPSQAEDNLKTPEELIEENFALIKQRLAEDLFERVFDKSPAFFENLVVRLLVKMGYGASLEDPGVAIGRSGDGGIDGTIKEDRLGLDMIYIQAKKWDKDQSVGRPEIHKFVGALAGHGVKKGVFITTASFTEHAKNYMPHNDTKIVLIDGKQLMQLMIDYNLGVTTEMAYEIKRIDNDFFDES
jgi:Restriction endonuclease